MGFFAKIDENKIVTEIIYVDSDSDPNGILYLKEVLKLEGTWVEARNSSNSVNHASVGLVYIDNLDTFMPPKPFESWTIVHNPDTLNYYWSAPVDYPADGRKYSWNEETLSWDLVQE